MVKSASMGQITINMADHQRIYSIEFTLSDGQIGVKGPCGFSHGRTPAELIALILVSLHILRSGYMSVGFTLSHEEIGLDGLNCDSHHQTPAEVLALTSA